MIQSMARNRDEWTKSYASWGSNKKLRQLFLLCFYFGLKPPSLCSFMPVTH